MSLLATSQVAVQIDMRAPSPLKIVKFPSLLRILTAFPIDPVAEARRTRSTYRDHAKTPTTMGKGSE